MELNSYQFDRREFTESLSSRQWPVYNAERKSECQRREDVDVRVGEVARARLDTMQRCEEGGESISGDATEVGEFELGTRRLIKGERTLLSGEFQAGEFDPETGRLKTGIIFVNGKGFCEGNFDLREGRLVEGSRRMGNIEEKGIFNPTDGTFVRGTRRLESVTCTIVAAVEPNEEGGEKITSYQLIGKNRVWMGHVDEAMSDENRQVLVFPISEIDNTPLSSYNVTISAKEGAFLAKKMVFPSGETHEGVFDDELRLIRGIKTYPNSSSITLERGIFTVGDDERTTHLTQGERVLASGQRCEGKFDVLSGQMLEGKKIFADGHVEKGFFNDRGELFEGWKRGKKGWRQRVVPSPSAILERHMAEFNPYFREGLAISEEADIDREQVALAAAACDTVIKNNPNLSRELVIRAKLKFANLPIKERELYPYLALSKREQIEIVMREIEKREVEWIGEVAKMCKEQSLSVGDWRLLWKLATSDRLCENNRDTLRKIIEAKINQSKPMLWASLNRDSVDHYFPLVGNSSVCVLVSNLKRNEKAKVFFQAQRSHRDEEIFIPRWFHATQANSENERRGRGERGFESLLKSRRISNEPQEGSCPGAWISTQMEEDFGDRGIALGEEIEVLDVTPNIVKTHLLPLRWRGVRSPILLKNRKVMLWVPHQLNKIAERVDKVKAVQALTSGKAEMDVSVVSAKQMAYMQSLAISALGTPNLSWNWWSKCYDEFAAYVEQPEEVWPEEDNLF